MSFDPPGLGAAFKWAGARVNYGFPFAANLISLVVPVPGGFFDIVGDYRLDLVVASPTAKASNPVQITTALGATLCFVNTNNAGGYGGNSNGMFAKTPGQQSSLFQPATNGGRTVICGYYNLWASGFTRWNATIGTLSDFAVAGAPTKNIFGFDMNGSNQASVGIAAGSIGGAASGVSGMGTVGTYHTVGVSYVQTDSTHSTTIIQPDTAAATTTAGIAQVPAGMDIFAIGTPTQNTSAMEPVLWTAVLNTQLTAAQMQTFTKFKGDIPPGLLIKRRATQASW